MADDVQRASAMNQPPQQSSTETDRVDEAAAETFPASDPPPWPSTHAGLPAPPPWVSEHAREQRAQLRSDLERLRQAALDRDSLSRAREDLVARAMLEAGRSVIREPLDGPLGVRNLESELLGTVRDAPCVVVGCRYDVEDVTRIAMLLAVIRAFGPAHMRRTVRFVAFADEGQSSRGARRYADRLHASRVAVHAAVALKGCGLERGTTRGMVVAGPLRSRSTVRTVDRAFGLASRIPVRSLTLPSWWPGLRRADRQAFWGLEWPSVVVADRVPWRASVARAADPDRMIAAVPGLTAAVERLAGGRV